MSSPPLPDPGPVLDLIEAFRRSKTMFASVELGVFDRLEEAPATAAQLADRLEVNQDALERLLDGCVGLGLVERDGGGCYRNAPVASVYLRRASPRTFAGYVLYSNRMLLPLWNRLEEAVRNGSNRWNDVFGVRDGSIFSHFFKTEESMRDFLMGMHGYGLLSSPVVVAAFDLSRFGRLVDLGGATGHLAIEACRRYPGLNAVIFDLPGVIRVAREYVAQAGLAHRIELAAGDFFRDDLPQGDLYSLGRILHDWSEPKIRKLLARIYEGLPEGGGLLISEALLDADKRGPTSTHMQSLNMLVCTEGKERTFAEYRALLADAGFRQVDARSTGRHTDAILALK